MIKDNLLLIQEKIRLAEIKAGRKADSVKLMAVSKFHPVNEIQEAIASGQNLFGENRVQEAKEKFTSLFNTNPSIQLHIIGQLQSNKVKNAVSLASCIQSLDRLDLLKEIEKQASKINKQIEVLFELHTGEESKSGYQTLEELEESLEYCASGQTPHVIPKGFMTMAPFTSDESLIRKSFITLREASEKMKKNFPQFSLDELSMGMSGDFEIAIEEGSTLVRVGTAIFGERDYSKK